MFSPSLRRAVSATVAALVLTATFAAAQDHQTLTKPQSPAGTEKLYSRDTPTITMDRGAAFMRRGADFAIAAANQERRMTRPRAAGHEQTSAFARKVQVPSPPALQSFGAGDGDRSEIEPNDVVAQSVALPVNLFGQISVALDTDYFAFQALAGQQINVEAFAARVAGSDMIADLALFNANGNLLSSSLGSATQDPLIRYTAASDQVLIVGITDADDLGGSRFNYLLNITRGLDADEVEPNDQTAQSLSHIPVTLFGDISTPRDLDFYSFTATAGQTLIVDVDAEVFGSALDAEINLSDPTTGEEFFYNDQSDGDDPRFNIVLPYTGRYVIGVGAFNADSKGFYRMNLSLVSGAGAPIVTQVTRVSKKLVEVSGAGFVAGVRVNVNGVDRTTTFISSGTLRAKVRARTGDALTVANPPDYRRSNPIIMQ